MERPTPCQDRKIDVRDNNDELSKEDMLSCIVDLAQPMEYPCVAAPVSTTVGFHVSAIMQQVDHLHIGGKREEVEQAATPSLFAVV